MTIKRDAVYAVSDDVVAREIEGEIIIVPLVAGIGDLEDELFTLNETGKAIWDRLAWSGAPFTTSSLSWARITRRRRKRSKRMSWVWWRNWYDGECWLRSRPPKPSLYAVRGGVLSLSGTALKEFLKPCWPRALLSALRPGVLVCTHLSRMGRWSPSRLCQGFS